MKEPPPLDSTEGSLKQSARWRSRLWMVSPMLLILVALNQIFLVKHFHLNPSKGGGFRMFSTADHYTTRILRPSLQSEGEKYPIMMADWDPYRLRIVCMPNESLLKKEANRFSKREWVKIDPEHSLLMDDIRSEDPREQRAFEQMFLTSGGWDRQALTTYPRFFVPADHVSEVVETTTDVSDFQVEAFRILYEGNGRFSSRFISTSKEGDE